MASFYPQSYAVTGSITRTSMEAGGDIISTRGIASPVRADGRAISAPPSPHIPTGRMQEASTVLREAAQPATSTSKQALPAAVALNSSANSASTAAASAASAAAATAATASQIFRKTYSNGMTYEGEMRDGKRHGSGTLSKPDGSKYEGQFANDQFHGTGQLTLANGDICDGVFEGNVFVRGIQIKNEGTDLEEAYEGAFQNGQRHGHGTLETRLFRYTGGFRFGRATGDGVIEYKNAEGNLNGIRYKGQVFNGHAHGKGTWTTPDSTCDGSFKNGLRHGPCEITFSDGSSFEGDFKDDEGTGTFKCRNYSYSKGKLSGGDVIIRFANTDTFIGEVENGKMVKGVYFSSGTATTNGTTYNGEMRNGRYHGIGSIEDHITGRYYEGTFVNGRETGNGRTINKPQTIAQSLLEMYNSL